jgi:hypothetical protein
MPGGMPRKLGPVEMCWTGIVRCCSKLRAAFIPKQVGGELGISEITAKAHRRRMMQKMKAPLSKSYGVDRLFEIEGSHEEKRN